MRKFLAGMIILIGLFFIVQGFWGSQLAPVSSDKSAKIFVVGKGESFSKVVEDLKKADLIKSSWVFNIYGKQSGLAGKIQAGTFRLSKSYPAKEILKVLTDQPLDTWVTLLEGWRIEEMAEALSSKFNFPSGARSSKFLKIAREGYMFPDTYLFLNEVTEEQIVKTLKETFDKKYTDDLKMKIKAQGLTGEQGVILASIVEREARSDQARMMVASILLKRFKIGMGLNADATIQYALGYQKDEKSWWKRNLTKNDLTVVSPYNTYLYSGLPPSPICNPGLSSLTAVASADPSTPYLYYYHDSKGNAHYTKTLEEHNQNIANYP